MTVEMLATASGEFLKEPLRWTANDLKNVLDSEHSARGKHNFGGPSPKECGDMIESFGRKLLEDKEAFNKLLKEQKEAAKCLSDEVIKFTEEI